MSILEALQSDEKEVRLIHGVTAGIVTNNHDPQGLGRVKIKFRWLSDKNETDWVRMATLMAGPQRGSFFLPEVGDEVLVAFEHGDINYPFVIGMLWNGRDKPPETNRDGKNNIRMFRSRSGHELIFNDDSSGRREKIEIHTRGGHKIILDDSAGAEKIEITDKTGNNKIVMDSVQNSISIESAAKLTLKAPIVEVEAVASLSLKSNAVLTVRGTPVRIN